MRGTIFKRVGEILAVLRPEDPAKALELGRELVGVDNQHAFDAILRAQEYTFLGVLGWGRNKRKTPTQILHPETRKIVGALRPGDSFVPYDQYAAEVKRHAGQVS